MQDLVITTPLLVLILVPMLFLLSLVGLLAVLLSRSQNRNQNLLMSLLSKQTQENQSLRNQLRAADVVSLHGLNSATAVPPTQASQTDSQWVPTYDDGIIYQENLDNAGYGLEEPSDEFAARGWDAVVTGSGDGGSPVRA